MRSIPASARERETQRERGGKDGPSASPLIFKICTFDFGFPSIAPLQ